MELQSALCEEAPIVQLGRNNSLGRVDSTRELAKAYYLFGVALNIFCMIIWLVENKKYERTRIRPTLFVWMAMSCSLAEMGCAPLNTWTEAYYPCWLGVVLLMFVMPFGGTSVFGRYMLFNFLSRFAQSAADVQANQAATEGDSISLVTSGTPVPERSLFQRIKAVAELIIYPNHKATSESELYDLKALSSRRGIFGMAFVICLPFSIFTAVILSTEPAVVHCINCGYSTQTFNLLIGCGVVQFIFAFTFWYTARKNPADDRWGLRTESSYSTLWVFLAFISFLSSIFDPTQDSLQPYTHLIPMTVFFWMNLIQQSLVQIYLGRKAALGAERSTSAKVSKCSKWLDPRLFYLFWTSETCSSGSNALNKSVATRKVEDSASGSPNRVFSKMQNGKDELDEILHDRVLAPLFEKHLIGEFGVESLFFVKQAEEWRRQYYDIPANARVARAKRIFKAYVTTTGLYSVNLPSRVTERIKRKVFGSIAIASSRALDVEVVGNATDLPVDLFDDAVREIRYLLITGAVLRFKRSPAYRQSLENNGGEVSSLAISVTS